MLSEMYVQCITNFMYKKRSPCLVQMPPFAQPNICAKFQEFYSFQLRPHSHRHCHSPPAHRVYLSHSSLSCLHLNLLDPWRPLLLSTLVFI